MSIFRDIMDKIFHHGSSAAQAGTTAQAGGTATAAQPGGSTQSPAQQSQTGTAASTADAATPRMQSVDVEEVLVQMSSRKSGDLNWRTSIVDLLKLLDLDSSLAARKSLANELNVHAAADGTAEQNVALHRAVMDKLAENGGKVPESLKH
jgi:hypothetical protein